MKSSMNALSFSLAALLDKFDARTVTSTDANGTNVTATASGAAAGSYEIKVTTVATKGQLSPIQGTTLSVADPAAAIFEGSKASFAVQGTDGVVKAFQLTNNSLNGLRDAINASGAGVTASVINSGTGTNPYQLVITAKETGTGTTGGVVTLAAIDNEDTTATVLKDPLLNPGVTLGITAGKITGTFAAPTAITDLLGNPGGGLNSSGNPAKDAVFTINGIQLTRKSNVVTDAASGVTFTLKQGGQTGTTTLTVAQDKGAATAGMQDVIAKYNTLMKGYKEASTSTKNSDGSINQGVLAGEVTSRNIINQVRETLGSVSAGLSGTYSSLSSLGIQTLPDGTLSLNTVTFQAAVEKDPVAARRLFSFSGDSSNGILTFDSATDKTGTGTVAFVVTEPTPGTFAGTFNGVAAVAGANGTLVGTGAYEGLVVKVTAAGSGNLTLGRGAGLAVRDLLNSHIARDTGSLTNALTSIQNQNRIIDTQIAAGQSALDKRRKALKAQFSKMEVTIAQMRGAAGMLSSTTIA
jgi:flagellar hook-associated protein 2